MKPPGTGDKGFKRHGSRRKRRWARRGPGDPFAQMGLYPRFLHECKAGALPLAKAPARTAWALEKLEQRCRDLRIRLQTLVKVEQKHDPMEMLFTLEQVDDLMLRTVPRMRAEHKRRISLMKKTLKSFSRASGKLEYKPNG